MVLELLLTVKLIGKLLRFMLTTKLSFNNFPDGRIKLKFQYIAGLDMAACRATFPSLILTSVAG